MTTIEAPADLELVSIGLDDLHPADDNPRHDLGDLTELAASIASIGVLQPLVVVERAVGGGYTIVAGHRRHAAARTAGVEQVPCVVRVMNLPERQTAMLVENLHRRDLDPLDEATGFQHLADLGHSQRAIAELVGCNQSHVSRRLALTKLPERGVEWLRAGTIQVRQAEELAALPEDDIDDVVAKADGYRRDGAEMPSWAIDEAIRSVASDRKRAAAIATAEASGKKQAKSRPYDGAGDYRPCKKAEATHWFIDAHGTSVIWCRTAKADAKARAEAGETPVAKPDWQIRQEIADGATTVRRAAIADVYTYEPATIVELGTAWLVAGVADGLRDLGYPSELVEHLAADSLHLMAFSSLAQNCRPPTWQDEPAEEVAFWQVILDRAAQLSPPGTGDIDEGDGEVGLDDLPDIELPGMWERADFEGGETDVNEQFALVDAAPAEADDDPSVGLEELDRIQTAERDDRLAETDGPDDVDEFGFFDPVEPPKRPWSTYDGNDERRICKLVAELTVPARVHDVIAYERANANRGAILVACDERLSQLGG